MTNRGENRNYALTVVIFTVVMTTMYTRLLEKPKGSIFLFGPRKTGKPTWIRKHFHDAVSCNLLDSREALRLERNPHLLFNEVQSLQTGSWVVLDEMQKVPALLDEAYRLIESRRLRFVLCGSSARKLKRGVRTYWQTVHLLSTCIRLPKPRWYSMR
ncbi:MAG: hypothetical protein DRP87_18565 [Spirochaetes bacterium]|nr:MAG: hypothetical protein DRP87_18565 [Spirochaetota bacterium]